MPFLTRTGLISFNIAALLWGVVQIIGASVALNRGDPYRLLEPDLLFYVHITNIVVGVIIIIMAVLGCLGVFLTNSVMIKVYAWLMTGFLVIEVILIVVTISFVCFADPILTKAMDNIFVEYGQPKHLDVTYALDLIQHLHLCCGVRNYTDWEQYPFGKQNPQSVADGCCQREYLTIGCGRGLLADPDFESKIYNRGCFYALQEFVLGVTLLVGLIMLIVALLQLMCVVAAFKLHKKIFEKKVPSGSHELEQTSRQVLGN